MRWTYLAIAVGTALGLYLVLSPWPVHTALGHLFAYANCASPEAVGLAPARRGKPGYWTHLDADNDGVSCEPWPNGRFRYSVR
ncbi:excalibur calcium-binding domain-containing protein [Methyloceanibacter stevinii]|uniref:excalibur calcium-binding domain-containing protein n=1 Tax=Methyloceanibacter stevinii TaxID=1774970 RepID=UPI0009F4B401|nr:excalibur calcium-binding domain-containing protein [Methyloceanibacter stevinii]